MAEAVETLDKGKQKEGVGEFIRHTREELDRTTFPSSEDVRNTTIIVIISVIFLRPQHDDHRDHQRSLLCGVSVRRRSGLGSDTRVPDVACQ